MTNPTPFCFWKTFGLNKLLKIAPLGTSDRADFTKMTKLPDWRLKFEILEVYLGDKYQDTVISEIHLDGLDVH